MKQRRLNRRAPSFLGAVAWHEMRNVTRTPGRLRDAARGWRFLVRDYSEFLKQAREHDEVLEVSAFPRVADRTPQTDFDPHYVHQGPWVFRRLAEQKPSHHVDVGSSVMYLGFFSALCPTTFVDIRPTGLHMPGLQDRVGDKTGLPFKTYTVPSLSCRYFVEHVGPGRYGDTVDYAGAEAAVAELSRVLEPGGHLYPAPFVERPRLNFDSHRVHHPVEVITLTSTLLRLERSVVSDDESLADDCTSSLAAADSGCGLYLVTK